MYRREKVINGESDVPFFHYTGVKRYRSFHESPQKHLAWARATLLGNSHTKASLKARQSHTDAYGFFETSPRSNMLGNFTIWLVLKPNHDLILADELVIEVAIFWLHKRETRIRYLESPYAQAPVIMRDVCSPTFRLRII